VKHRRGRGMTKKRSDPERYDIFRRSKEIRKASEKSTEVEAESSLYVTKKKMMFYWFFYIIMWCSYPVGVYFGTSVFDQNAFVILVSIFGLPLILIALTIKIPYLLSRIPLTEALGRGLLDYREARQKKKNQLETKTREKCARERREITILFGSRSKQNGSRIMDYFSNFSNKTKRKVWFSVGGILTSTLVLYVLSISKYIPYLTLIVTHFSALMLQFLLLMLFWLLLPKPLLMFLDVDTYSTHKISIMNESSTTKSALYKAYWVFNAMAVVLLAVAISPYAFVRHLGLWSSVLDSTDYDLIQAIRDSIWFVLAGIPLAISGFYTLLGSITFIMYMIATTLTAIFRLLKYSFKVLLILLLALTAYHVWKMSNYQTAIQPEDTCRNQMLYIAYAEQCYREDEAKGDIAWGPSFLDLDELSSQGYLADCENYVCPACSRGYIITKNFSKMTIFCPDPLHSHGSVSLDLNGGVIAISPSW